MHYHPIDDYDEEFYLNGGEEHIQSIQVSFIHLFPMIIYYFFFVG
jgi:hypothetical protein